MVNYHNIPGFFWRIIGRLSYTPLLGLTAVLAFLKIATYALFLNVDGFGLLAKMLLVSALFGVVGSLGFHHLAHRNLPRYISCGKNQQVLVFLAKSAVVITLTAMLLIGLSLSDVKIIGLVGFLLLLSILHGWSQLIFQLVVIESKSRLKMHRYSLQQFLRVVLATGAGVGSAIIFGNAVSVLIAEIIITVILVVWYFVSIFHTTFRLRFSGLIILAVRSFSKTEWRSAIILLAGTLLAFFSINVDRWLAASILPTEKFGLYSFAWISLIAAQSVQVLLNAGFYPLLVRRHITRPGLSAFKLTAFASISLLLGGGALAFIGVILGTWLTEQWYPDYIFAVSLFPLLFAAAVFRLADFWTTYLIVVHRETILLRVQVVVLLILFTLILFYEINFEHSDYSYDLAILALVLSMSAYITNGIAAFHNRRPAVS